MTSSDGYISILSFMEGELGDVYEPPAVNIVEKKGNAAEVDKLSDVPSAASEVSKHNETNMVVTNLMARKKPASAAKSDTSIEKKKVTFGDPLDDRSTEKKRTSDGVAALSTEAQAVSVNILVAKKKKKVLGSSTPVATM